MQVSDGFRPLSGKWGYRYVKRQQHEVFDVLTSFRPLSGKWGYRSTAKPGVRLERQRLVSVPSRGNGVIDMSL